MSAFTREVADEGVVTNLEDLEVLFGLLEELLDVMKQVQSTIAEVGLKGNL